LGIPHQLALLLTRGLLLLALTTLSLPVVLALGLMDVWLGAAREMAMPLVLMLLLMLRRSLLAPIKRAGRFAGQTALAAVARESRTTAASMCGTLVIPVARLVHLRLWRSWQSASPGGAATIRLRSVGVVCTVLILIANVYGVVGAPPGIAVYFLMASLMLMLHLLLLLLLLLLLKSRRFVVGVAVVEPSTSLVVVTSLVVTNVRALAAIVAIPLIPI